MKRFALQLLTFCLTLVMLVSYAVAETVTDVDYTVTEKLIKQLQAGSGFTGTLTLESIAVAGREGEAITTLKPLTFDVSYIYVREDSSAKTEAESRTMLTLVDGEQALGTVQFSLRGGALYMNSPLIGDGWYALKSTTEEAETADAVTTDATVTPSVSNAAASTAAPPAEGSLAQVEQSLLTQTAMPGLAAFAANIIAHLHGVDTAQWDTALESYTTKIDLWIEAYRQKAVLGKLDDGTTTMEVVYQMPASAVKAQLKQMLMDLLADDDLLAKLQTVLSAEDVARYLNPALQSYYFYAIDSLPLDDNLEISRTVSLKGDTLALTMALPLHDSQGGAMTLRYDRHKGEGDLPDENTIELQSDSVLLKLDYQTYDTLTGTTVYQGNILRQPLGTETFEVGTQGTPQGEAQKTFSATFTLSSQQASATDADNRDTLTSNIEFTLTPEYTPDVAGDEATVPTEAQTAQFIVFKPLDIKLDATFASGQAKNASTSVDATLEVSGDQFPEVVKATFSGKTKGKWTPDKLDTESATKLGDLSAADLQALLAQAGIKSGLMLLPYVSLPSDTVTETPAATSTPAS